MTSKSLAMALAAFMVLAGLSGPAFAQDAMMSEGAMAPMADGMMPMDPMAEECFTKAHAETDMMKMDTMMAECVQMYPDAAAADCYNHAHMETDAMKMDEMMASCTEKYPDAMGAMQTAM